MSIQDWRQKQRYAVLLAGALCVASPLLAADKETGSRVDYGRDVLPVLLAKCVRCHGPDETKRKGDLRLDRADALHGTVIVPGQPAESSFIQRIMDSDPASRMPPPTARMDLTKAERELLTRWVSEGARSGVHWAYVRPSRPEVPETDLSGWPRNEIDRFILARLEAGGLRPAAEADRETLIRRVTLDLTGLPPAPRQIDRFLADQRSRAYERLVDRALASQHYGERMAQDWLDLARYGDTNGYENDSDRQMWLYRDWVINAFNTNMPYDRFVVEQIAGDLLPDTTASQTIASGFNRNTTYNEEGGADAEEFLVAYAVERASTTATVFLGITLGCAQCHEHKYDPFTQAEFYRFYAFFNSVEGERGATGHDIALPPLLSLPTNEQNETLRRTYRELWNLELEIVDRVASATILDPEDTGSRQSTSGGPAGDVAAGKQKPSEKTHFSRRQEWEKRVRAAAEPDLPEGVLAVVRLAPEKRDAQQRQLVRDYFVEYAYSGMQEEFALLHQRRTELTALIATQQEKIPTTMVMAEMTEPRDAFVLVRGNFENRAEKVTADVPAIFPPLPGGKPKNRLGLGYWLVDPANPLVARVAVNRIWKQLFGVGLVSTMEDFGVRGDFPSHPKLLDWLATEFVRSGWDVKALQKEIMLSAAYRQRSVYRSEVAHKDPYNRLVARQTRFRLSAEGIRDVALSIGGLLNEDIGGPSVYPFQPAGYYSDKGRWKWPQSEGPALYRRGLYTFWRRTTMYPSFQIFDAPTRETCVANRAVTNTPLQALVTLNDPTFVESARAFARRILKEGGDTRDSRLRYAYRVALGRLPDEAEWETLRQLHSGQLERFRNDSAGAQSLAKYDGSESAADKDLALVATWTALANVFLNLDETITRN
ncbi:MAG: PSD1 and planctomycete cytochrome C domain-containing protein [Planctomycetota bacterium]|nr:PSD1 and planctomycete cytochrome C domain-containing protein [Planctomycetota bacterium]